jgi:hypothetical protein
LSNWYSLVQKKEYGGLGVLDLRDLNLCLLASWIQRGSYGNGLWMSSTNLVLLIFSVVKIDKFHPFEKGLNGLPKQPE